MPNAAVLGAVEASVRETTSAHGAQPATVGYGFNATVRITIYEDAGAVSYDERDAGGSPGVWSACSP